MKGWFIFFVFLVFVICGSCKKDTEISASDSLGLLTAKSWKPAMVDRNAATNPQGTNLYYAVLDCERDDSYTFNANGKLTILSGHQKCGDEADSELVDYNLNTASKQITIGGVTYALLEVSATQLKYSIAMPFSGNIIYMFEH